LGDEESADFLLTLIAKPLVQQATLEDIGADVNLETTPSKKWPSKPIKAKESFKMTMSDRPCPLTFTSRRV